MRKKVLIIGILGQDGVILSSILKDEYNLFGICRPETNEHRIEEFENSLGETMKEFRKLQDSLPDGLKTVANGRISTISSN
jgi:GDP-D-mannose dehydratase